MQERSLRRDGVVMEARVWKEDRDYLRCVKISAGQAIRAFVAAHRGDEDVQKVAREAQEAEDRAAALRAAAMTAQERLAEARREAGEAQTAHERRVNALAAIRAAYVEFHRWDQPLEWNVKWVVNRIAANHPELRKEDPLAILKEIGGEPVEP